MQKTIVLVTHDIDEAIKLADRIAILKVGGILAQVGPPEELLRAPADDFVADFLGDDRGIKRLSIMRVGQAQLTAGPVVAPGAAAADARAVAWRPRGPTGWPVSGRTSASPAGSAPPRWRATCRWRGLAEPFAAVVHPETSLKAALGDGHVLREVAVVVDSDGRYRGVLTLDDLAEGVR